MAGERILDQELVNELLDVMGDDFEALIHSFVRDAEYRLEAMDKALSQRDMDQIRDLAHGFKGSSSNLGAVQLSTLCRELEQAGREARPERASGLLERAGDAFETARRELTRQINDDPE